MDKEAELTNKDRLLIWQWGSYPVCNVRWLSEVISIEFDYISYGEMGISGSTFRRLKCEAINILGTALNINVITEKYIDIQIV